MKTIYITEAQKKKIKKAIAAQDQVGGKVNAGVMDAVAYGGGMCENVEENNLGPYFETWYRGYDSKYPNLGVPKNQGMWITDEIEYAKEYALEFGEDGRIAEVVIDIRKVKHTNEGDMWDMDIDPYYSDETTCEIVKSMGYNSWICDYFDDNAQGICLIDTTPIVSVKILPWRYNSIDENVEEDEYELGAEKGMSPYYHVNESNEEIITLYHGVNRKGLEFNLENGGFIPRVCSEGGPKAVWLSEKQYNYEFTFAFDFPKSLVEQLSNVDYVYGNKIGFDEFNCRLVKSNLYGRIDSRTVVEVNLLDERLSKIQFRYFPDLGMLLWKEYKEFPLILEKYINPYIEKYQTLSESKKKVVKNDKGEIVPETCDKCGGKVVVQIHGEPVYVCKDCGKYFGTVPFTLKENVESEVVNPEDVDLSSFNIKKNLNPKFWKNGVLDSRIRLKLLDIADDFIEFLGIDWAKPEDITMTGSLANFNWDENYSDIDLHIIMDYSDVDEKTEFVSNYFYSQKKLWNEEHSDITIMGYPVEVFVQDVNERHDSSGVYSLEKNKWLIEPEREKLASSKVNKAFIKDKVSEYMNKIDKLEYLLNKSKDDEYKLRRVMEKSDKLFDKIKGERKIGFERSGGKEINNYNIVFKALRRNGYIEKLVNVKSTAYDKLNSLQ